MAILRVKDGNGNWQEIPAIVGPRGPAGPAGPAGANGQNGAAGANATVNGVNVLIIQGGDGIEATMSGSTLTIKVKSHNQAASTITAGTFAGQVVANSSGQTPGTSLLRNSKLVSTDTDPTVNGEINWTYG